MAKKQCKEVPVEDRNVRILHNMVGPYPQGRVVSVGEMKTRFGEDFDLGRLLTLNSVEFVKDSDVEPDDPASLLVGPENTPKDMKRVAAGTQPVTLGGDAESEEHGGEPDADEDVDPDADENDDPDENPNEDEPSDDTDTDEDAEVITDPDKEGFDPAALNTAQLKAIAKDKAIKGYKTMSREKLIKALAPE